MTDIPEDVMNYARRLCDNAFHTEAEMVDFTARAIMAERERCASKADRMGYIYVGHAIRRGEA